LKQELRAQVDDTLDSSVIARRGFFEPSAVRRLVDMDRRGVIDGSYTIFALMSFELWCRRFIDA